MSNNTIFTKDQMCALLAKREEIRKNDLLQRIIGQLADNNGEIYVSTSSPCYPTDVIFCSDYELNRLRELGYTVEESEITLFIFFNDKRELIKPSMKIFGIPITLPKYKTTREELRHTAPGYKISTKCEC